MPDFGLTEALEAALKASGKGEVMRPAEKELAARAARTAPQAAAPAVPDTQVARMPSSAQAPSATPAPGETQAPALNPSEPPPQVPPPSPDAAAAAPEAAAAPPQVAQATDAAAPAADVPAQPQETFATAPAQPPTKPALGNQIPAGDPQTPPQGGVYPNLQAVTAQAESYVRASLPEFGDRLNMSHMPNVDVMQSPDGVKAAILQVADDNKDAITAAKRGTITDEQLTAMAQDLAVNSDILKQVMTREFGASLTNGETALAARMVEQQQVGTLMALADRVVSGNATSEELVRFEQQQQIFQTFRTQLSGTQAEWGRAGRGLQIPVGLPREAMDHISDVISRNNPNMQSTAKAIKLAGTPQGIASIVQGSLWYRALVKAPFQLLQRIYINGILSGAAATKIAINNTVNLGLHVGDMYAAAAYRNVADMAMRIGRWPTPEEGATWADANAHLHGVISAGADALRVAGRVLKTGQSLDGILRSEEDIGKSTINGVVPEINNTWFGSIAKGIDTGIGLPGRGIGSIDAGGQTFGFRGWLTMRTMKEVQSRLEAGTLKPGDAEAFTQHLIQNPDPAVEQEAEAWAHRVTFQSPWPVDADGQPLAGAKFQAWLNAVPAARFIFPFMRTARNIFAQAAGRSPLAFLSARLRNDMAAGGVTADIAKARVVTGTAVGSMLGWMAIHDRITGDAPKDPKARLAWEADGRQPYSVRFPDPFTGKDTWHSYLWFEPLATHAGIIADAVQLQHYVFHTDNVYSMMPDDQRVNDAIAHIMASVIQNTGNKTFMQGAAQFSEMYNDPARAFDMWKNQMGAAAVPYSGALKLVRNEQDPYLRQAFTLMDAVRNELPTIPGVNGSKTLMPRLDFFGEPRKTAGGNSILGPLTPMESSPIHKDDVTDEISKLMEQTRTVPLTMPSRQMSMGGSGAGLQEGQGMQLNPQEYYELVRSARSDPVFNDGTQTFHERLRDVINNNPVYKEAAPPERAAILSRIQREADQGGRNALWHNNEQFRQRLMAWQAQRNRLQTGQ